MSVGITHAMNSLQALWVAYRPSRCNKVNHGRSYVTNFFNNHCFFYGTQSIAQNFEYPITPIDDIIPIEDAKPICRITNIDARIQGTLAQVHELLACGFHKEARAQSLRLTKQIEQLMDNSGDLGTCWEERNCTGTVLKVFVTRSACKDLLEGKSWQQKRPEQGVCINL